MNGHEDAFRRARDCRALAANTRDTDARRLLLEIAAELEAEANQASPGASPFPTEVFGGRR